MEELLEALERELIPLFRSDNSGHDIYHCRRVLKLALDIQEKEGGDRLVIAVAAFLHDVHRAIQNETGQYCSPKDSLSKVLEILARVNVPAAKVKAILHCIEHHEGYSFSRGGNPVHDLEALIVQDADNLDALGAIGIARVHYGSANGNLPIWSPDVLFDRRDFTDAVLDPSAIHHFQSKLLRLVDTMNTKTAGRIALGRHLFMKLYLEQFFGEWNGER